MKKIVAVILVVVFIATGLGGAVYAQSNGHEPITGQKLVGTADIGKIDSGQERRVFIPYLRIYNPDCLAEINVERMFIMDEDDNVLYDGPFLRTPASAPGGPPEVMTRPLNPHEAWECFLPACIPDGEGGWFSVNQVLNHSRTICTVEIFWSGAGDGCPLVGEITQLSQLVNRQNGNIISEATATHSLEYLEQIVAPLTPKDSIVIGAARPITGDNSFFEELCFGPIYRMWVDEVNAQGGIYVAEYGQSLPIELLIYDDESDLATMAAMTEKLIVEDQVDILLPTCGSNMVAAQAPIANKYGYVLITAEGGDTGLREALPGLPYTFVSLPYSENYQLPVLADMLAAEGAETAYIVSIADLHGIEYAGMATMEFNRVGIDVVANVSVPLPETNFEPIVQDAMAADPDVFCCFAYPNIILPITSVSMAFGFNPDAFLVGPGGNFGFYATSLGGDVNAVNGVLAFAAANEETSPEIAQLFSDLEPIIGYDYLDYWGAPYYRALLQIWQQAIEATGTLDQDVLRDYIATATFDTVLGPTWFESISGGGGLLAKECHTGEIGQWQNGVCEIVGGGPWSNTVLTGDFIYPKPLWPGTPQNNQVLTQFKTFWDYSVLGDSFTNGEVIGWKRWDVLVDNQVDATGAPLTGVNLRLDSGLAFENIGCQNGTLVTQGPPVYEWSFSDVTQGASLPYIPVAWVGFWSDPHPFPVTFTPGFDASRVADQTVFPRSGVTQTQTLTIAVTPREQVATEGFCVCASVPTWGENLADAVILPPSGVDFALAPGGKQLWMWPTSLAVGVEWTVNVIIEVTPVPQGAYEVPQVDFMPCVSVERFELLSSGYVEGNTVSYPAGEPADGLGNWTWSVTGEGDIVWNWEEAVMLGVIFNCYCEEYPE